MTFQILSISLVPSEDEKPSGAFQLRHILVQDDLCLIPVKDLNAAQILGAQQVDLTGDAVESDDQAAGGETL